MVRHFSSYRWIVLLLILILLGVLSTIVSAIYLGDSAIKPIEDSSNNPLKDGDWNKFGKSLIENAPEEIKSGSDYAKAGYAFTKYLDVLDKGGITNNENIIGRFKQAIVSGDAEAWTCSDHTLKLDQIFRAMGIPTTTYVSGTYYGPNKDLFQTNSNHGAIAVKDETGAIHVFDAWMKALTEGNFKNGANSAYNGMYLDSWEKTMETMGFLIDDKNLPIKPLENSTLPESKIEDDTANIDLQTNKKPCSECTSEELTSPWGCDCTDARVESFGSENSDTDTILIKKGLLESSPSIPKTDTKESSIGPTPPSELESHLEMPFREPVDTVPKEFPPEVPVNEVIDGPVEESSNIALSTTDSGIGSKADSDEKARQEQENIRSLVKEAIQKKFHNYDSNSFSKAISLGDPAIFEGVIDKITWKYDPNLKGASATYLDGVITTSFKPEEIKNWGGGPSGDGHSVYHELTHAIEDPTRWGGINNPLISRDDAERNIEYIELIEQSVFPSLSIFEAGVKKGLPQEELIGLWEKVLTKWDSVNKQNDKLSTPANLALLTELYGIHLDLMEIEDFYESGAADPEYKSFFEKYTNKLNPPESPSPENVDNIGQSITGEWAVVHGSPYSSPNWYKDGDYTADGFVGYQSADGKMSFFNAMYTWVPEKSGSTFSGYYYYDSGPGESVEFTFSSDYTSFEGFEDSIMSDGEIKKSPIKGWLITPTDSETADTLIQYLKTQDTGNSDLNGKLQEYFKTEKDITGKPYYGPLFDIIRGYKSNTGNEGINDLGSGSSNYGTNSSGIGTGPEIETASENTQKLPVSDKADEVQTEEETKVPVEDVTEFPTEEETKVPVEEVTEFPTEVSTSEPTSVPTEVSTSEPTAVPTEVLTPVPTAVPTEVPTPVPTAVPTEVSTSEPTAVPTEVLTPVPTAVPTEVPTPVPTAVPTGDGIGGSWVMGGPTNVGMETKIQGSGSSLQFINENGVISSGSMIDSLTVVATDWGPLIGHITNNGTRIDWENGSFWVRN